MTPRERRGRPAGPRGSGPPRGRTGPARPPEIDPARLAALELLTAVRVRDAYANLALPAILRRAPAARPRRGARHRAGLRHPARPRPARRRDRRVHRPAARAGGAHRCSTPCAWAPTSCCAPGCRRTPPSTPPSSWCGSEAGSRRGRVRQRRAAPGGRSATRRRGCSSSRRTPWRTRWATRRSRTPTRGGSRRPSPTRSAATARARRGAGRRRRPPRGAPARPARARSPPRSWPCVTGGTGRRTRRTACTSSRAAATSGELDAVARGAGRRAGRGQPAGGARRSPGRR